MTGNKSSLSVPSALLETHLIWRRDFWFLIVITLVLGTPRIVLDKLNLMIGSTHSAALSVISLISSFGIFVFEAMYVAAVIGLLSRPFLEKAAWPIIWTNVKTYTWTLVRVIILLGIVAVLAAIPLVFVFHFVSHSMVIGSILIGVTLLLVKYALAYPLVVVEQRGARDALRRSWEMTRGHFGFVLGCYLILWLGGWAVEYICGSNARDLADQPAGIFFLKKLVVYLVDSLWIILSWCMYLQIKAADEQTPPVEIASTNQ